MRKQMFRYAWVLLVLLSYPIQAVALAYAVIVLEDLLVGVAGITNGHRLTFLANLLLLGGAYIGMLVVFKNLKCAYAKEVEMPIIHYSMLVVNTLFYAGMVFLLLAFS
jgi:hypothetical protein